MSGQTSHVAVQPDEVELLPPDVPDVIGPEKTAPAGFYQLVYVIAFLGALGGGLVLLLHPPSFLF